MKNSPEDFLVEEITPDGRVIELDKLFSPQTSLAKGEYAHFVLQKKNWTTEAAIKNIAKSLHTTFRRFNFAGSKDKNAITTQLVSFFGGDLDRINKLTVKDMKILGAWYADKKIDLGDLIGNRFTIKVRDCEKNGDKKVKKIITELSDGGGSDEELNGEGRSPPRLRFPNYFGGQRFGSTRKNTHIIGEKILKNDYESAMMAFLCDSEGEEHQKAKFAREELKNTRDYSAALKNFPQHLRLERSMLAVLEKNSNDYIKAFRALPRSTLLMFVHAFQSHLFNEMLSERIGMGDVVREEGEYFCGENHGFPDIEKKEKGGWLVGKLIGYETELNEREKAALEKFQITREHFSIRRLPEISSRGTYRTLFAPLKDFSFRRDVKAIELRPPKFLPPQETLEFKFSLQSGSYATTALREFVDTK
jgi:tRNA pseudouridine13 synthase